MEAGNKEAILEKIQALLNLSIANGATEHEALVAGQMAAKLLLKHNLTLDDINLKYEKDKEAVELADEQQEFHFVVKGTWSAQYHLACACAKITGCEAFFNQPILNHGIKGRIVFVGVGVDRSVAINLFNYFRKIFLAIIPIEKKRALSDQRRLYGNSKLGKHWEQKFYQGICDRVAKRLREEFEKTVQEENAGDFMMVKYNAALAYVAENMSISTRTIEEANYNIGGYQRGYDAGEKIGIPDGSAKLSSGMKTLGSGK